MRRVTNRYRYFVPKGGEAVLQQEVWYTDTGVYEWLTIETVYEDPADDPQSAEYRYAEKNDG